METKNQLGEMITLKKIADPRGNLTVAEQFKDLPFGISRVYWTYDIIIALSGSFTVTLDNGSQRKPYMLTRPYEGLFVDTGIWRTLENFSSGAVCLVLAEDPFDVNDYIYDYDQYLAYISRMNHRNND